MAYLPLFLSIHQNICDNALDMSRNKYQRKGTAWQRIKLEERRRSRDEDVMEIAMHKYGD